MDEAQSVWPHKRLRQTRARRMSNVVATRLTRWGLIPRTVLLTTTGRRTGLPRSVPVTLVQHGERTWLVAPYGPVAWVLNARAQGSVSLRGRSMSGEFTVRELSADEAGPILKDYVGLAGAVRPYFSASKNAPISAFVDEAHCHPVFELTPSP